jgi:hypothetical protein
VISYFMPLRRSDCSLLVAGLLVFACAKPSSSVGALERGGAASDGDATGGASSPNDDGSQPKLQNQGGTDDAATPVGPRAGGPDLLCGNANGNEECDDGKNDGSYGTCRPDCTIGPFCGDGSVDGPEQCDLGDGNEVDPYGPDRCTTECNWAPYCGDGVVQPPEECDGGQSCDSKCKNAPIL